MKVRKNKRRVSALVSSQTLWHLRQFADQNGFGDDLGAVVDQLVKIRMMEGKDCGGSKHKLPGLWRAKSNGNVRCADRNIRGFRF